MICLNTNNIIENNEIGILNKIQAIPLPGLNAQK